MKCVYEGTRSDLWVRSQIDFCQIRAHKCAQQEHGPPHMCLCGHIGPYILHTNKWFPPFCRPIQIYCTSKFLYNAVVYPSTQTLCSNRLTRSVTSCKTHLLSAGVNRPVWGSTSHPSGREGKLHVLPALLLSCLEEENGEILVLRKKQNHNGASSPRAAVVFISFLFFKLQ